MKLIARLFCGLVLGLLVGLLCPDWCVRLLVTLKSAIGQLIAFSIPFIILFFVTHGLTNLPTTSDRLLGKTLFFAYTSTITAGMLALGVGLHIFPTLQHLQHLQLPQLDGTLQNYTPFIELKFTPFLKRALIAAFVLVLAFIKHSGNTQRL